MRLLRAVFFKRYLLAVAICATCYYFKNAWQQLSLSWQTQSQLQGGLLIGNHHPRRRSSQFQQEEEQTYQHLLLGTRADDLLQEKQVRLTVPIIDNATKTSALNLNLATPWSPNGTWPELNKLIGPNGKDIVGNVQHLLDFVIAGHPKTGTTSLMTWLSAHPQVYIHHREIQSELKVGNAYHLVNELHRRYRPGFDKKRGYKAPNEIHFRTTIRLYAKYWPTTKIIVGLRHPVSFFKSWYNFKINNHADVPPVEDYNDNTVDLPSIMRFHENLSLLSKTSMNTADELQLLGEPRRKMTLHKEDDILQRVGLNPSDRSPVPNKVFLYETMQADSRDPRISEQFRNDLSTFLEISPIADQPRRKNTITHVSFEICETKFRPLRQKLIAQGAVMAEWILTYFVKNPDVTLSSPAYFEELLQSWSVDPCETNDNKNDSSVATNSAAATIAS